MCADGCTSGHVQGPWAGCVRFLAKSGSSGGKVAVVDFAETMEWIAKVFEAVGVGIIVIGGVGALAVSLGHRSDGRSYFDVARRRFGRPLLLGLEVLVAADVIKTVTVDPSLEGVTVLAVLVLIRTILSFTLDVELDGILPWRKAEYQAAQSDSARSASG
jgi:uncharacterized membrane protein